VGRGLSTVSPVYIDDLIKGLDLALDSDLRQTSVILSGPRPVTKRELIWGIADTLGVNRPKLMISTRFARMAAMGCEVAAGILKFQPPLTKSRVSALSHNWGYSHDKAELLLEYHPEMDLAHGLQITVEWYRKQGWL
jgi:nucleoside-diphosphate-sugar epimerase